MRICSMTATFGKLEGETLEFTPGLNLISAPNEWGKSTWCAFLLAMLYGIDTRQRAKQGHHAKHVVKKTCSVSAEQPRFVVHHCRAADHMVEAGVIGVKTAQAEQKQ